MTRVDLKLKTDDAASQPTYSVRIQGSSSSLPDGTDLGTLTTSTSLTTAFQTVQFTSSAGVDLRADTTYWVVIDVGAADPDSDIAFRRSDDEDGDGTAGWSLVDTSAFRNVDGSGSWQNIVSNPMTIAIYGHVRTGIAPEITLARVHGTKLTLRFHEPLAAAASLANSAFTVKKTPSGGTETTVSVTGVAISGNALTLTLWSAVAATDTGIKVSYTKPTMGTNNRIEDAAGNETDSFTDQAVTINRAPTYTGGGTGVDSEINAPSVTLVSLDLANSFSDPDGDTLTISGPTPDRDDVFVREDASDNGWVHNTTINRLFVTIKPTCELANLDPPILGSSDYQNHITVFTLTATDPYGASVSVKRRYKTSSTAAAVGGIALPPCNVAKSFAVDGDTLTLTYEGSSAAADPSGLKASQYTVKVNGKAVTPTAFAVGTTTDVPATTTPPAPAKKTTPVTLTLPDAVWAGDTVTVSHSPPENPQTVGFTDEAVTNSETNHRPAVSTTESLAATVQPGATHALVVTYSDSDIDPGSILLATPGGTSTSPDDTLTITATVDPADVIGSTHIGGVVGDRTSARLTFIMKDLTALCALSPVPATDEDGNIVTKVTVTATDSDGASVDIVFTATTPFDAADCAPTFESASVDEAVLTLTFERALDEGSEPAPGDFALTVAGATRSVSAVDVSGLTVVLTLSSAVAEGETVTVGYTKGTTPLRLEGGTGSPAETFAARAVTNVTGETPTLESAVVHVRTLTMVFDEALDESSVPARLAFTVTARGSERPAGEVVSILQTGVAVSGARVVLTLASDVIAGETVTVRYDRPTTGATIRDTHANRYEAASFSGAPVDNRAGDATNPRLRAVTVQGKALTLTYDEQLDPAHEPPIGSFIVDDDRPPGVGGRLTVTGVEVTGRTVVLTLGLAEDVTEEQAAVLVLTYNIDEVDFIQDFAGNPANLIATGSNQPPGVRVRYGAPPSGQRTPSGGVPSQPSAGAPVASAGSDFAVDPGAAVTLDGSASSDPDGDALAYAWSQVSGTAVTLAGANTASASFTAPEESGDLSFSLTVTDPGGLSGSDEVVVTVSDLAPAFGDAAVASLVLVLDEAMDPVVLPEATGGNGALSYGLTSAPAGLAGLSLDAATRTLSGTPGTEGNWVFTWRADDADANRADTDAAILTFRVTVEDARTAAVKRSVRRTLAAVARRALSSPLDNIGARFAASVPMSGLALAGETVPLGVSGAGLADAGRSCPAGGAEDAFAQSGFGAEREGCAGARSRGVEAADLMWSSAFSLNLGAAGGSGTPSAPLWSVWGRGDLGTFAGQPEGMRYEGELRTGWLGMDARSGAWVAGLAVSHGTGEADYSFDVGGYSGEGSLETELTAVYPYGRWTLADGLELRGVLGAGWGEASHRLDDGPREKSDLSMRMASAGLRHELPALAGIDLAVRADASLARMETEKGPDDVDGLTADSWRVRAGLEASRRIALEDETALTPFVEAAAREDGGDGLEGAGLEIAGGLRYTAPRLHVEARGRWLAAHSQEGAQERGVSVTARMGPGAHGRGLSLMLSPRWGAGTGAAAGAPR
ncbi:MAG: hypothetical protein J4G15_00815 [Alphaproteobacteria bacterium]|nr:hypothetical protein [Alphaproteobacteria bacterium]